MRSASLFVVAAVAIVLAASLLSPALAGGNQGGEIRVAKVTTNGDTRTFHFSMGLPGYPQSFDLAGGASTGFGISFAGDWTITEEVPVGWILTKVECLGTSSTFALIENGVIVTFVVGDTVTCTFTNSPVEAVGGVVIPASTFALLSPWLAVIGLVGCVGTATVLVRKRRP